MSDMVIVKSYPPPTFCPKEALRYAGCAKADVELLALVESCRAEVWDRLSYKVCYRILPFETEGSGNRIGNERFCSAKLAAALCGCSSVIVFAATVGVEIDRLIARYGALSPSRALILQGIGAERAEALCDAFQADMERELSVPLGRRFSPGYGDLALSSQESLFRLIDGGRRIGVSLNDSMLMSPSKTVTAFVGVGSEAAGRAEKDCGDCNIKNCPYRGNI